MWALPTIIEKLLVYCLVAGGTGPLDEYVLQDLEETYKSQGLSLDCAIAAVEYIKFHHGLEGDSAVEAEVYIDYLLKALQCMALSCDKQLITDSLADTDRPLSEQSIAAIHLLQSWLDDEDEDEQRETGEFLIQALDEDRPFERKLFPVEMKGVSW